MKAIDLQRPAVENTFKQLASDYLHNQISILNQQLEGIRENKDIEFVHQARVASRRMREALIIFGECFEQPHLRKWRKSVRRLTKQLGAARDTDVQIEAVTDEIEKIRKSRAKYIPGLKRLVLRLRQRRQRIQPKVIRAIDKLEAKDVLGDIGSEIGTFQLNVPVDNMSTPGSYTACRLGGHISKKIERLLGLEGSLADVKNNEGHHKMRIAAKKLRYSLEISKAALKDVEPYIDQIKRLQTMLGELQDCTVWGSYLKEFKREEKEFIKDFFGKEKPFSKIRPGIEFLSRSKRRRHSRIMKELVKYWSELRSGGTFESLLGLVQKFGGINPQIKSETNDCKVLQDSTDQ